MELRPGQHIEAPFLSAPAEVKQFQPRPGHYLLEVVLDDAHHTYQAVRISESQLARVRIIERHTLQRTENAEDLFFLIEAHRLRLAYQFDPQLAVSVSQVDPLPHQIEAVYHYVLRSPRIRFLIADDPGAGKTIMAGLILKELQYRHLARRILIVAPGHLKYQWQREMKERFGMPFTIVDRAVMNAAWAENIWEGHDDCIASINFVKQDAIRESLRNVHWDLVIVDEAHKMSAYLYESKNQRKVDKTKRYRAGEILSQQTEHMLFLTATPHRGDEENFRLFLDLLRPGFFAHRELLQESIQNQDNPIFIRRLKEDMRTFSGTPLFPPRHVQTISFRLTPEELDLYNAVTHYVQEYFDKAKENRSISFALMILQRRLTSSTYAVYRSLQRRKERMEELLTLPDKIQEESEDYLYARRLTAEELDDLEEEERLKIETRLEKLTIAQNIEQVRAEITELDRLIVQAEAVRRQEMESKLVGLRDGILAHLDDRKLLIFTEFKDTLDYLAGDGRQGRPLGKLREWGYDVITIDGTMNMDARITAEHDFRDRAQIMVATEAAGEGINLQFCSLMVNYDIPWNPNRLEQRMGRIHRYGQHYEVYIWNLITQDTREGQILERLFTKLDRMREALGSDRVFDIIDDVLPGTRLDELLRDAIFSQRRMEEIEAHIDTVDVSTVQRTLDEVFLTGLATRHIDYTGLHKETLEAEENRLVPEYVGDYFLRAFKRLGGAIETRTAAGSPLYSVPAVPFELRQWGENYDFKTTYGQVFREYRRVTFDKDFAKEHPEVEFVAPGHPLLEAVNETILTTFNKGEGTCAVFGDPEGQREGIFWFVEGEIRDGRGAAAGKRVFCLYQGLDGTLQPVNPAILWDHKPLKAADIPPAVAALLEQRETVKDHIITDALFPYQEEIAQRREHEAAIKEKYGLRSLDYLIQESNQKILDYQLRQASGEVLELPLLNEQRTLDQLRIRRQELEEELRMERNLTVGDPRFLGAAVVLPLQTPAAEPVVYPEPATAGQPVHEQVAEPYAADDSTMYRDPEVEAIGMRVAMEHERAAGWQPEDVAAQNLGFDVRSTHYNDDGTYDAIRYIEVKARAHSGAIRLSANEWKKARHFGEKFWIYVVTGAKTETPELHTIKNPAAQFRMEEEIVATGYIIQEEAWRDKVV